MTQWFLHYQLQDGYLHNWLVAGPQLLPVGEQAAASAYNRQQVAARFWQPDSAIAEPPCEQAKFTLSSADGAAAFSWRYVSCADDHLLDLAGAYPPGHYLRTWAYSELLSPMAQRARLALHAYGPAQVWLNGHPVLRQGDFCTQLPHELACEVSLVTGENSLLIRLEQWVGAAATPYALALHVGKAQQEKLKVRIPTLNQKTEAHQTVERLAQKATIDRDLYSGQERLQIKWPNSVRSERKLMVRVQKPSGAVVSEAHPLVKAATSLRLLEATTVKDGPYQIRIMAEFEDFIRGLRVSRDLDVNLLHSTYTDEPQGDQPARAIELLQHAAWWTEGLFAQIAIMALGLWRQVNTGEILRAIDRVLARGEECDQLMIGLLLMAYRYTSNASFPQAVAQRLEECLLAFDYASDETAAQNRRGMDEDLAILDHVARLLAGQLYSERLFVHSGQAGRWHQEQGEQLAQTWLARRAQGGFASWDSGEGYAAMLLGLVALVDHAASEPLAEMAAAITDKLLFTLAINSFRGVFGSAHGSTSAASITDGRMEPTSGVSRLLWGVGCWNQHIAASLALAASQKYQCPPVLQLIALDHPEALWCRERHIVAWRGSGDGPAPDQEVNKVTYKTPDYMLSSAQDYRPGAAGLDEHIWQATLSPGAVVFVNHPGCMNQKKAYRPNFWCGNRLLPRVAQWRDLLIALYRLPDDDWLGYTHAHFPVAAFDQTSLKQGWAFARKGDAYLALTAFGGMTLIKSGPGAHRELRSTARHNVWLCQLGRAAEDGAFADFQKALLALPITYDDLAVSLVSLRGDPVAFGWTGPLMVKGNEQPLNGFSHYESPHCTCELGAVEMEIRYAEWMLRLNLDTSE
jgi:hypothetical protein